MMIKGKNIDPIFIFKSKNARKLGKKRGKGDGLQRSKIIQLLKTMFSKMLS